MKYEYIYTENNNNKIRKLGLFILIIPKLLYRITSYLILLFNWNIKSDFGNSNGDLIDFFDFFSKDTAF